ncbi:hypothetical protein [Actinoallomurus sp. CA-150999]|uniref:hypothetical protein n=1 Tax=Actinoallomurus sp. CA-150999 TaxID=3239887 RepID=UPI003D90DA91
MAARASIQKPPEPHQGIGRRTRGPLAALACAALLLSGCNSGAAGGSGGGDHGGSGGNGGGGNAGGGGGSGGGTGGGRYGFGLPSGPTGGEAAAGAVYEALEGNDCEGAQRKLDEDGTSNDDVKDLLRIGIAVCRGRLSTAQSGLSALHLPGWDSNTWFLCELYRASSSVVHQRPRSAFGTCPPPPVVSPDPSESEGSGQPSEPANSAGPSGSPESSSGTGG